jgi:hypothetical protein
MIRFIHLVAVIALTQTAGGCWTGVYEDPAAEYLRRTDTITASAGNAKDLNAATHTIDPWNRRVGNRRITADGDRMTRAVTRYKSGQGSGSQSQSGPQVIGIPVGAATPTLPPGSQSGSGTPAQ